MMQKSSIKYLQTDCNNTLKRPYTRDARMAQHMQINKRNAAHKQNQGQKSHHHLTDAKKKSL
jgi:hypothetical protein